MQYDENRATITTAADTAEELKRTFQSSGITTSEIGLLGRFHSKWYSDNVEAVIRYVDASPDLRLPDASSLVYPTWSNSVPHDAVTSGSLHAQAIRGLLVEKSEWYDTFHSVWKSLGEEATASVISFGPERCVPPSQLRKIGSGVVYMTDVADGARPVPRKDDDIAVIGMSIKTAGADDTAEFWDLLCSAESQHKEVPPERVSFKNVWRDADTTRKWYGNFINDHDAFDHRFFKKTALEMASTDPQQRQMLQVAYQAVQQSGHFNAGETNNKKIGCYIGICNSDYDNNISSHKPNAFMAVGNLRSFIAGKISHWFGWHGPSLAIDSACSSSLVAVHHACRAILSGECSAALAGGGNMIMNNLWYENLAAANFLSPTGQCKPFDAKADGYCRGEGFAAVFLKKMSQAIADGDQIIGTISATAVLQNQNCTPVFVPNSPSLAELFETVVEQAQLAPEQITVAEAHGTGTQVGDPAEYAGLSQVLGGSKRSSPLALGSVKGSVGHTESASGAISLLKTLLMINRRLIPPQASFDTLNPAIQAAAQDNVEIATVLKPWVVPGGAGYAALINNYGASGSNASVVVTEAPKIKGSDGARPSKGVEYPIRIFGNGESALKNYSRRLRRFLQASSANDKTVKSVANLSFNLARQSNPNLDKSLVFGARSVEHLVEKLNAFEADGHDNTVAVVSASTKPAREVILCFGGQISTFVGLDREVYDGVKILREHLHACNTVCMSLPGVGSIFPGIFQRTAVEDPVKLQIMLFAMQYSCAKSWIECGVKPVALTGHSFGELVAMCVSGILSLQDALKMVAGRAAVIKESWGPSEERGAMMAVEGSIETVKTLLAESGSKASIACYNGPTSFTLAGTSADIDRVAEVLTTTASPKPRYKRLNVTHAFHSTLVEPIMPLLVNVGRNLTFNEPTISLERATEFHTEAAGIGAKYVADHMREPVFFSHTIGRLARQYPSAIFLEAGSNSTVTVMAGRALGNPKGSHFQAVNITGDNGFQQLAHATLSLWKEGLRTTFWPHHRVQTHEYAPVLLPPYQFEKSRHWMEMKAPPELAVSERKPVYGQDDVPQGLFSLLDFQDINKRSPRFRINTTAEKYRALVSGHIIAKTAAICPATLIIDIAIEALISTCPPPDGCQPRISDVINQAAICIDESRTLLLAFDAHDSGSALWDWKLTSSGSKGEVLHVTGQLAFVSPNDATAQAEFKRYERLVGYHQHCVDILGTLEPDDIIHGARNIYRAFSEVVDYAETYQGLQRLVGKGNVSAGRVTKKSSGETWLDAILADCWCQVGGLWVNCMTDCGQGDMYIATGIEKWARSPAVTKNDAFAETWDVLARHERVSEKAWLTDVFVFNSQTGRLTEAILGINYHRVTKVSMSKTLIRLTPGLSGSVAAPTIMASAEPITFTDEAATVIEPQQILPRTSEIKEKASKKPPKKASSIDVEGTIRLIIADISGLEPAEITMTSSLAELGIDSLMGMELGREMEGAFKQPLMSDELADVVSFRELVAHVSDALGVNAGEEEDEHPTNEGSVATESDIVPSVTTRSSTPPAEEPEPVKPEPLKTTLSNLELEGDLQLSPDVVFEAFEESKRLTDDFISEYGLEGYMDTVLPRQTYLCVALTVEAFEELGCRLRDAKAGETLQRIPHQRQHERLAECLYRLLEHEARLIDISSATGVITRTAVAAPSKSSRAILDDLLESFPGHEVDNRLTFYAGSKLADVLRGEMDGIKLIFGTEEGRELVTALYGNLLLNELANAQMRDVLTRLIRKIPHWDGPLRIMELGAGTGGTTKGMIPLLGSLGVPVEYTFTDLAGSFVAAARKKFGKEYQFMKFRIHDIEQPPADDLLGTQHIVIAHNAIHATRSLVSSVSNIRKALRPDGFLLMLEMTQPVYWVDMIFGLFEGWWLFEDGRRHAIAHQKRWQADLQRAGFGRVDWTDGWRPEIEFERLIIAQATVQDGFSVQPTPMEFTPPEPVRQVTTEAQAAQIDEYVRKYTQSFHVEGVGRTADNMTAATDDDGRVSVAVTGATGSLGSHLVAQLAMMPAVRAVYCLNRRSTTAEPEERQAAAFRSRGIDIPSEASSKIHVLAVAPSKPGLGLDDAAYRELVENVTHVVHNAWTMSEKRPVSGFEEQFKAMRALIDLSRDVAMYRSAAPHRSFKLTFQFISTIAIMGNHSLLPGNGRFAPEERAAVDQLLPNGYAQAKLVCERMLDETLHRHPSLFRVTAVRPGQIAGSSASGYWNEQEHLSFLIKSSQTLRALPAMEGDLCWTPVDSVAGTLADLLLLDPQIPLYPVYHVDNPVRQDWASVLPVLASELGIPRENMVPFREWVRRVRSFPGTLEDNPAARLINFLDNNFIRMSCGGMLLETKKTCEHSTTLRGQGPVSAEVVKKYVDWWKHTGFLRES